MYRYRLYGTLLYYQKTIITFSWLKASDLQEERQAAQGEDLWREEPGDGDGGGGGGEWSTAAAGPSHREAATKTGVWSEEILQLWGAIEVSKLESTDRSINCVFF